MSAFASLILFVLLAIISLGAVSWVNAREKKRKILTQKLKEMRRHIMNTEELILDVDQMVESRSIAKLINDEIVEMIQAMKAANPETGYLDASYQTAMARAEALADESVPTSLDRLKDSDAQIARSKHVLEEAATILRRQQATGKFSFEEMNAFLSELSWAHLMVDVISHVGQGHKALRRHDVLSAHAFYKKAQQMLMHSAHPDKRRHRFIKELSEMLANKRVAVSEDIMPETHLNPEPSLIRSAQQQSDEDTSEIDSNGNKELQAAPAQENVRTPEDIIPGNSKRQSSKV